jgi:hypothetical protein
MKKKKIIANLCKQIGKKPDEVLKVKEVKKK